MSEREREREKGGGDGAREGENRLPVSWACKVFCAYKFSRLRAPFQGHPCGVHVLGLMRFLGI